MRPVVAPLPPLSVAPAIPRLFSFRNDGERSERAGKKITTHLCNANLYSGMKVVGQVCEVGSLKKRMNLLV